MLSLILVFRLVLCYTGYVNLKLLCFLRRGRLLKKLYPSFVV